MFFVITATWGEGKVGESFSYSVHSIGQKVGLLLAFLLELEKVDSANFATSGVIGSCSRVTHLNKPGQLLEPHLLVWTF